MCQIIDAVQNFFDERPNLMSIITRIGLFFTFCSYLFEIGTDQWVGIKLIHECHLKYAIIVFSLCWILPATFNFIIVFKNIRSEKRSIGESFCLALFGAIFYVPLTAWCLLKDVIKFNEESLASAQS